MTRRRTLRSVTATAVALALLSAACGSSSGGHTVAPGGARSTVTTAGASVGPEVVVAVRASVVMEVLVATQGTLASETATVHLRLGDVLGSLVGATAGEAVGRAWRDHLVDRRGVTSSTTSPTDDASDDAATGADQPGVVDVLSELLPGLDRSGLRDALDDLDSAIRSAGGDATAPGAAADVLTDEILVGLADRFPALLPDPADVAAVTARQRAGHVVDAVVLAALGRAADTSTLRLADADPLAGPVADWLDELGSPTSDPARARATALVDAVAEPDRRLLADAIEAVAATLTVTESGPGRVTTLLAQAADVIAHLHPAATAPPTGDEPA